MADVNVNRLMGLGMSPELSVEVRKQIDAAVPAPPVPVPYSEVPEDLAAALVAAGLMEPDA